MKERRRDARRWKGNDSPNRRRKKEGEGLACADPLKLFRRCIKKRKSQKGKGDGGAGKKGLKNLDVMQIPKKNRNNASR